MSLSGNELIDQTVQNNATSKRQQKKFTQILRQIAASQNPQPKSHKKRRNPTEKKADPQARKLIKIQSQQSDFRNKEGSSSVREISEDEQRANPSSLKRELKDINQVYNKNYGIAQQSEGFSEYMVNYTYSEKSKYLEKQCEDWTIMQALEGKKIVLTRLQKDEQVFQSLNLKLSEQKEKVRQPFTKDNKDFVRKVLGDMLQ